MPEQQNKPEADTKKKPQRMSFNLQQNGQLNFEGELNSESAEILTKLLQQAEYYRAKTKQSDTETIQAKQQIDSITMTFLGCVLTLMVFGAYSVVSSVSRYFSAHSEPIPTSYQVYEPWDYFAHNATGYGTIKIQLWEMGQI